MSHTLEWVMIINTVGGCLGVKEANIVRSTDAGDLHIQEVISDDMGIFLVDVM